MSMKYLIAILCILYVATASVAGAYENNLKQEVDYSLLDENDKMLGWLWKDFNIKSGEKVKKVKVFISTEKNFLGKWTGAFGSSTSVAPAYWTMTEDLSKSFTKKPGAISWELDAKTSGIIQQEYGGQLKWGVWWIDCTVFTIDKIVVFTDAYRSGYDGYEDEVEKKAVRVSAGVYKAEVGDSYVYKDLGTEKMLPINWSMFTIPKGETITKIDVTLSTTAAKLGKWQGAFGSSTNVEPDYWIMTKDMAATLTGQTGTVSWNPTTEEAKAMQTAPDGQLKFGV